MSLVLKCLSSYFLGGRLGSTRGGKGTVFGPITLRQIIGRIAIWGFLKCRDSSLFLFFLFWRVTLGILLGPREEKDLPWIEIPICGVFIMAYCTEFCIDLKYTGGTPLVPFWYIIHLLTRWRLEKCHYPLTWSTRMVWLLPNTFYHTCQSSFSGHTGLPRMCGYGNLPWNPEHQNYI